MPADSTARLRAFARAPLSRRAIVATVLATLVLGAIAVEVVPGSVTWRIRWLRANHTPSADPAWDAPVDGAALRRAAAFVHRGDTYALWWPSSIPQYGHDLPAAGYLYLTPARPAADPRTATWILSYKAGRLVPPGVRAGEKHELAPGIFLVRTLRR